MSDTSYGRYGVGTSAAAEWSVRYELRDASNAAIADITDLVTSGSVDFDPDKAVSGQFTGQLDRPFRALPYRDFLAPIVTITPIDGRPPVTRQQGLFRMRRGAMTWIDDVDRGVVAAGRLTLDDLTGTVRDATLGDTYNVAAGVRYTDAATLVIQEVDLPDGIDIRVNFPNDSRTLPAAMTWGANESRLKVAGDLLAKIGCYTPWASWDGVLTSTYYRDVDKISPSFTYVAGVNSQIIAPPQTDSDDSSLSNQITVVQEDTDPAKRFRAVWEVSDPTSDIHRLTIGLRPRTDVVSQYADQAAVTAYARRLAGLAGSVSETLSITTHLDLGHEAYELYAVDLSGASRPGDDQARINGRWRSAGLKQNFDTGQSIVRAARTQPFVLARSGVIA